MKTRMSVPPFSCLLGTTISIPRGKAVTLWTRNTQKRGRQGDSADPGTGRNLTGLGKFRQPFAIILEDLSVATVAAPHSAKTPLTQGSRTCPSLLFASQQRLRSLSPPSCRNPAAAGGRDGYVEGGYGLGWYGGRPYYYRPFGAYGGSLLSVPPFQQALWISIPDLRLPVAVARSRAGCKRRRDGEDQTLTLR